MIIKINLKYKQYERLNHELDFLASDKIPSSGLLMKIFTKMLEIEDESESLPDTFEIDLREVKN